MELTDKMMNKAQENILYDFINMKFKNRQN